MMTYNFPPWFRTHGHHLSNYILPVRYEGKQVLMMDIGYHISDKFIPISDIMSDSALFSPVSLITDIGLSAHLCVLQICNYVLNM
jgi:hypothetical protein